MSLDAFDFLKPAKPPKEEELTSAEKRELYKRQEFAYDAVQQTFNLPLQSSEREHVSPEPDLVNPYLLPQGAVCVMDETGAHKMVARLCPHGLRNLDLNEITEIHL